MAAMKQEMNDYADRVRGNGMENEAVDAVLDELPKYNTRCCMVGHAASRVLEPAG